MAESVSRWRRLGRALNPVHLWRDHRFSFLLAVLLSSLAIVLLWESVVVKVPAGHQGVYFSRYVGGTREFLLPEGFALKWPWDEIVLYDIRIQEAAQETPLLTKNGLLITVSWSVRYTPDPARLPELHRKVGPTYADRIVHPVVVGTLRQILGNYDIREVYSADERALLQELTKEIVEALEPYPIEFRDVYLRKLLMPTSVAGAIEDQMVHKHKMLSYQYRLQAEVAEKQRRRIEAEGVALFEKLTGMSLLQWRGIDATLELAKSNNTKIVVIGTGAQGLPVLLNTADPVVVERDRDDYVDKDPDGGEK